MGQSGALTADRLRPLVESHGQRKKKWKTNLVAYAFLSPWIIGFILFSGVPILASFVLSLTHWDMISPPRFVGLENYQLLFSQDSGFWKSLYVTLEFTVLSVVVTVIWALIMALLLNKRVKGIGIFQFFYFVPAVLPSVAMAFVFQLIFNQQIGVFNYILSWFGVKNGPNWLMDQSLVIPTIVFISIYTYTTGQMMLIFNASLKEVPKELYEAAEIDGASAWQKFRHVTFPSISPVLLFNLVMATVGTLNGSFSLIYPLTGGGPGDATNVLSLAIFTSAFQNFQMGYASALSTILFILVALISYLQFALSKRWVSYES
ncbi:sugar ABC transporter permease [Alicyclobacillus cellulosilyticus]|uniref:Sugar ABC transporter permease n=1 Tax=Alicyclobacillus cellulosilyticus TaxID=1003997 RepID=A0A917K8E0_9BACL|nr:sugar ABC transporter permease [Alicyclobacillus cellulosilyticus]GGJ03758.1 sugar ABC transporter permease [Alicyclobacillus cellulosilyticus]